MKTIAEQINEVQQYFIKKIENQDVTVEMNDTDYSVKLIIDGFEFTYYYKYGNMVTGTVSLRIPDDINAPFLMTVEEAIKGQQRKRKQRQIEQLQSELQNLASELQNLVS